MKSWEMDILMIGFMDILIILDWLLMIRWSYIHYHWFDIMIDWWNFDEKWISWIQKVWLIITIYATNWSLWVLTFFCLTVVWCYVIFALSGQVFRKCV
jgi:hypothetical protein